MRFRTTLWMAIILLVLAGYLFFVELPQQRQKETEEPRAQKLFSLDESRIKSLRIHYPKEEIRIEKKDDHGWMITHPIETPADSNMVRGMISTIVDMRFNRVVGEKSQNPADYGLERPPVRITMVQDDREEQVIVGDDGPVSNTLYVQRGSDRQVVLVEQWIKGSLTRTLFDFRDKAILEMNRDKATELRMDFPKIRFRMAKEKDQWMIREPRTARADNNEISNLLLSLVNLRATGFVDREEEKKKIQKQIKKPVLVASVKEDGLERTVSIYQTGEKGSRYAVTTPDRPIYAIQDRALSDVKSDFFHYQDKHLLFFERETVARIEVRRPGEPYAVIRKDGIWSLEGESGALDQTAVESFLNHLKMLEARKNPDSPVAPERAGLQPPTTQIRLLDSQGRVLGSVAIGKESQGMLYASGVPELGIVLVSKDILDNTPKKNELVKPPSGVL